MSPPAIILLTHAETDLLALDRARARLPAGFPAVAGHSLNPIREETDLAALLAGTAAAPAAPAPVAPAAADTAAPASAAGLRGTGDPPVGGEAAGIFGVRRVLAAFDGGIYPPAPTASNLTNPPTPAGGQINLPVKSGDKSPHSKNTTPAPAGPAIPQSAAAIPQTPASAVGLRAAGAPPAGGGAAGLFGVRRVLAAFDGATCRAAPIAAEPSIADDATGGAINYPVKSGDKSPHSITNTAAAASPAAASPASATAAAAARAAAASPASPPATTPAARFAPNFLAPRPPAPR
ncbi:MAG: hypothetical protein LBC18_06710, partial [Opitutaceae bacterium]|nr:hypothetical protein [Opitutaceae bacterium]